MLAQSIHATTEWIFKYPEKAKEWYQISNYICVLSASEIDLYQLIEKASSKDVKYSLFKETDLNNELTAICIEPAGKKLVSNFPLALKENKK